jgi:thiamine-phosphate pyrophosphorylase
MELPRLQYITHPGEQFDDLSWVHRLHAGGVRWIQLRLKEEDVILQNPEIHYLAYFHEIADRMRAITSALGMLLTINDVEEVALFSQADGLHVGQEDTHPQFLVNQFAVGKILGGTANSLAEIERFSRVPMTYYGVGPFRETTTKSKLKPVLGLDGYRLLCQGLKEKAIAVPVFAIGGITAADVVPLLDAGVYGIALSGALFNEQHEEVAVRIFTDEIERYELTTGR